MASRAVSVSRAGQRAFAGAEPGKQSSRCRVFTLHQSAGVRHENPEGGVFIYIRQLPGPVVL